MIVIFIFGRLKRIKNDDDLLVGTTCNQILELYCLHDDYVTRFSLKNGLCELRKFVFKSKLDIIHHDQISKSVKYIA